MSKMKSSKLALSKLFFGFVVATSLIIVFACEQKDGVETDELVSTSKSAIKTESVEEAKIFFIVEEMPEFPGGDSVRSEWLAENINYPLIAQENGIQGKVYVSFVVTEDGSITNAKIEKGVDPILDQEALRVVNQMPKWKPGKQRGQEVNVSFTVPINFALQ